MGVPESSGSQLTLAMKLLLLALAACAVAEPAAEANANADPWYGYYGHHLGGYRGYYGGYGYASPYYGRGYYGHYGKRSAEPTAAAEPNAEANADPWYSAYGYGLGHYYGGYGRYYGGYARPYYGGYAWGKKKRSAEAEPAAEPTPDADAWYGHYGYGRGYYGYGLGHYGYSRPYYGGYHRGYYWG